MITKRNSRQKTLILEELKKQKGHPTAFEIFSILREKYPSIGFATVYRNLNKLVSEGLALELHPERTKARFDGCTDEHYHLFCSRCGSIVDMNSLPEELFIRKIEKINGVKIKTQSIRFSGQCSKCLE